jgi:hypothetical protein
MKKLIIVLFALTAGLIASSQPSLKIYGYAQSHLPGMVPKGTSGNGAQTSYFVYLQHSSSVKITPAALWIHGKRTAFKPEEADLPVVITNNNIPGKPVKTTLVPKNGLKTISFQQLKTGLGDKTTSSINKLSAKNELVIEYKWKGKTWYKTLKKLTVLEPLMGE